MRKRKDIGNLRIEGDSDLHFASITFHRQRIGAQFQSKSIIISPKYEQFYIFLREQHSQIKSDSLHPRSGLRK